MYIDPEAIERRRAAAFRAFAKLHAGSFDENGRWVYAPAPDNYCPPGADLPPRELLWACLGFFATREPAAVRVGQRILDRFVREGSCYRGVHGGFDMHAAVNIYCRYPEYLTPETEKLIIDGIRGVCPTILDDTCNYTGINDNFPSMYCFTALVGGRLAGLPELEAKGRTLLDTLCAMLRRRGFISEYNSPTYTGISAHAMADIVELHPDEEIRAKALACETRIWADILGHYQPPTGTLAGPHSRTYTVDDAGHEHAVRDIIWLELGDGPVAVGPIETTLSALEGSEGQIMHNDPIHLQTNCIFHLCGHYHVPEELAAACIGRVYPYHITGTTECRSRSDVHPAYPDFVYPGGAYPVTTYMTQDYSLGAALKDFSAGCQTETFRLTWRTKTYYTKQADIGALFVKYLMDNHGENEKPTEYNTSPFNHYIVDKGRKHCVACDDSALLLARPKHWAEKNLRSLRLSVMLPIMYRMPDSLTVGGQAVDLSGDGVLWHGPVGNIVLTDANIVVGLRPLEVTDLGRADAITVRRDERFLLIELVNREGEPADFSRTDVFTCRNGFLAEIRTADAVGGREGMEALLDSWEISDRLLCLDTATRERYVDAARPGLSFSVCVSMPTEDVKYATVNGRPLPSPKLAIDGFDVNTLPLMDE